MAGWWHHNRPYVLANVTYCVIRTIGATLRLKTFGSINIEHPGPKIYLMWHGRTFVPSCLYRNAGVCVIISHSRDGEMQSRIFTRLGFKIIRGSTGRGGERALVESIRCLKGGTDMAITPDGPRGPSGVLNMGVLVMAKKSGAVLIPVGTSARPRKLIKSWDSFLVPAPFAKCVAIAGTPMVVPPDASSETMDALREIVQAEMHRIQDEAEAMLGLETKSVPVLKEKV